MHLLLLRCLGVYSYFFRYFCSIFPLITVGKNLKKYLKSKNVKDFKNICIVIIELPVMMLPAHRVTSDPGHFATNQTTL